MLKALLICTDSYFTFNQSGVSIRTRSLRLHRTYYQGLVLHEFIPLLVPQDSIKMHVFLGVLLIVSTPSGGVTPPGNLGAPSVGESAHIESGAFGGGTSALRD